MVQRQSSDAQYQQNQRACGGLPEEQEAPCPGWHPGRRREEGGHKNLRVQINNDSSGLTAPRPFLGRDGANCSSRGFFHFGHEQELLLIRVEGLNMEDVVCCADCEAT